MRRCCSLIYLLFFSLFFPFFFPSVTALEGDRRTPMVFFFVLIDSVYQRHTFGFCPVTGSAVISEKTQHNIHNTKKNSVIFQMIGCWLYFILASKFALCFTLCQSVVDIGRNAMALVLGCEVLQKLTIFDSYEKWHAAFVVVSVKQAVRPSHFMAQTLKFRFPWALA